MFINYFLSLLLLFLFLFFILISQAVKKNSSSIVHIGVVIFTSLYKGLIFTHLSLLLSHIWVRKSSVYSFNLFFFSSLHLSLSVLHLIITPFSQMSRGVREVVPVGLDVQIYKCTCPTVCASAHPPRQRAVRDKFPHFGTPTAI